MSKWKNINFGLWLIYSLHGLDDRSYHKQQLMLNDVSGVTGREMTEPLGFRKVLGNSFNPWGVSTTTRDKNPITLTSVNDKKEQRERDKKGNRFSTLQLYMFDSLWLVYNRQEENLEWKKEKTTDIISLCKHDSDCFDVFFSCCD